MDWRPGGTGIRRVREDLSTEALVRANEANAVAFSDWSSRAPGVEVDRRPERFRVSTGIAHPIFNGVRSARLPRLDADACIEETRAYFAARKEPWFWWVWPGSAPEDLGDRLAAHGLVSRGPLPVMSVDLLAFPDDLRPPEGLVIARVADAGMLGAWAQLAGQVFGLAAGAPTRRFIDVYSASGFDEEAPMQFYTGYLGSTPVAASQLFLGVGVAGIYTVATLPEPRGHGFGTALTVASLRDARSRGYRWGVLQATKLGEPVYLRLGFGIDGHVVLYGLAPAQS